MTDGLQVLEGVELKGRINVQADLLLDQIRASVRRGHPQIRRQPPKTDRVVLVGGGPSLAETERDLVQLIHEGAKLVTMNGSYHWCLERNLRPTAQIVLDARPENARFVEPDVPRCQYIVASQCHAKTWDAVEGRENVWIFHSVAAEDAPEREPLDAYYLGNWHGVVGGTTVATRAISLLRMCGYLRFDLFGIDSCWFGTRHHAFPQPENETDKRLAVSVSPVGDPKNTRVFSCSPWHIKQLEDFLQLIRFNGDEFLLNVHGDGLIAHVLRESATISIEEIT